MLIFMSALLGPKELVMNLFIYTFMVALRKIFANSFSFACRHYLYSNFSKFEAQRARRYFRSSFTFSTIILTFVSYKLLFCGYWRYLMSFFTDLQPTTATLVFCLLSLYTHTYRRIMKGAMKALDLYRTDDVLLH